MKNLVLFLMLLVPSFGYASDKYELIKIKDYNLYRIKALKDFGHVKKGDLGGFIESEKNLSQDGNAWIYGDARVFGDAEVSGNAKVYGNAEVYGDAIVYGDAKVSGHARVSGHDWISGNSEVY